MTRRLGLWLTFVLVGLGCAGGGNFGELPQQDRDRFFRCQKAMQPALCGDDRDQVYVTMCIRKAEADYGDQTSANERRRWLVEQGCPPPMVNPGAYSGGEDVDRPPPRRQQPTAQPTPSEPAAEAPTAPGQKADSE